MSSRATCSAGWAKKDWVRCWVGVVTMGVAWGGGEQNDAMAADLAEEAKEGNANA